MTIMSRLADVAQVYERALMDGQPPTKAVGERFGVSQSTAGSWVAQARAAGLLGWDTKPRRLRFVAVAAALGVEYDDLVTAVREHADGDLRIV